MADSINHIISCSQVLDSLVERIDPHNEDGALEKVLIRSIDTPSSLFEQKSKAIVARIGRFLTRIFSNAKPKPYDLEGNLQRLSALFDQATSGGMAECTESKHAEVNRFADRIERIRDRAVVSLSKKGQKHSDRINRLNSIQFARFKLTPAPSPSIVAQQEPEPASLPPLEQPPEEQESSTPPLLPLTTAPQEKPCLPLLTLKADPEPAVSHEEPPITMPQPVVDHAIDLSDIHEPPPLLLLTLEPHPEPAVTNEETPATTPKPVADDQIDLSDTFMVELELVFEEPSEPVQSPSFQEEAIEPPIEVKEEPKPEVKPLAEHSIKALPQKKGYIVTIIGSERVKSFCPKVGAVVGFIFGFMVINYLINFQTFANVSQQTQTEELSRVAQKYAQNPSEKHDSDFAYPAPPKSLDPAKIAKLVAQLQEQQSGARENAAILQEVSTTAAESAHVHGPANQIKTALSYAQVMASGHVPVDILSRECFVGGFMGACIGYILLKKVANWLDKQ